MRTKRILAFLIVLILCSVFVVKGVVFAEKQGNNAAYDDTPASPSGPADGSGGCSDSRWIDTCHGAAWKYFPWPAGQTSYTIQGGGINRYMTTTISGDSARICEKAGGFFAYGFLKSDGSLYGTAAICGYGDWQDSVMCGTNGQVSYPRSAEDAKR